MKSWLAPCFIQGLSRQPLFNVFMEKKSVYHHVSTVGILKVVLVLLACYLVYMIRDVLVILFFALILTSVLEPLVSWLVKKGLPRTLSIVGTYLFILVLLGGVLALAVPPIVAQIRDLLRQLPFYVSKFSQEGLLGLSSMFDSHLTWQSLIRAVESWESSLVQSTTSGLFTSLTSLFGGLFSIALIFIISFYLLVEEDSMRNILMFVVPADYQPYLVQLYKRIQYKIGLWLRGYLVLAVMIWLLTFLVLNLFSIKYALILSFFAAFAEIIPMAGPLIAAIPAVILAFFDSPLKALFVFACYEIINLVESNILVPQVMRKAIGLNPVLVIIAILIGVKIGGFIGAIIAIPMLTAVSVFIEHIFSKN